MIDRRKTPPKPARRSYRVAVVVTIVVAGLAWEVYRVVSGDSTQHKRVVDTMEIKVIPPPPPKVEPPPPPPKIVEPPKIQPPIDKPPDKVKQVDEPPPGPLALDAKGGPGSDSFGLGGKQGGSDFLGGGGGGTRFGHYAVLVQNQIGRRLHEDDKLDSSKFRATVKIWVSAAGRIERVEVLHGTGDHELDDRIREAIATMPTLPEAPPPNMPAAIVRVGARLGNDT